MKTHSFDNVTLFCTKCGTHAAFTPMGLCMASANVRAIAHIIVRRRLRERGIEIDERSELTVSEPTADTQH